MKHKDLQTHIWATLLWIDTNVQLAKTNYVLGNFDQLIYIRKLRKYKKHVLQLEKDYKMYPNTYKYLLQVKHLIKTLIGEV